MVKENLKPIQKPIEIVYELKVENETQSVFGDQIQSFEEFMKDYKADESLNYDDLSGGDVGTQEGYGPGDKNKKYNQHLINTYNNLSGNASSNWWDYETEAKVGIGSSGHSGHHFTTSAGARSGIGGMIADANASYSFYKYSDGEGGEIRTLGVSAGGEAGIGLGGATAKAELGVDLYSAKKKGVQVRIGANVDTGGSIGPGGVEVKAAGFGFSVGKKTGLSTPIGEFSIDAEEGCVVQ